MFRKDLHTQFTLWGVISVLLMSIVSVKAQSAPAPPSDTISIPMIVTASYQSNWQSQPQTVTSNTANVTLENTAGVLLSPVFKMMMAYGNAPAIYPMTVRNLGSTDDSFSLRILPSYGWTASLRQDNKGSGVWKASDTTPLTAPIALKPGQVHRFFLLMKPPRWARISRGRALVVATSSNTPSMYAEALVFGFHH